MPEESQGSPKKPQDVSLKKNMSDKQKKIRILENKSHGRQQRTSEFQSETVTEGNVAISLRLKESTFTCNENTFEKNGYKTNKDFQMNRGKGIYG